MNHHYTYKTYRLQTAQNGVGWTCFVNEDYIGILEVPTEAEALQRAQKFVDESEVGQLVSALAVIVKTAHIRAYLAKHDPKALAQAEDALGSLRSV